MTLKTELNTKEMSFTIEKFKIKNVIIYYEKVLSSSF